MKKIRFILTVVALLFAGLTMTAETKLDLTKPEGTYVITDQIGKKLVLKLQAKGEDAWYGSATITVRGRTIRGTWEVSHLEGGHIYFETFGHVKFGFDTPSGPGYHHQLLIFSDGRVAGSIPEWYSGNTMKVKKVSVNASKKSSTKSKKKGRKNR